MEWKIGEIKQVDGEWYQCVEHKGCHSCAFTLSNGIRCGFNGDPHCAYRSDGKFVIFKKLEKVGEPIIYMSRTFQKLKSPDTKQCKYCYFRNQVCNPQLCGEESFLVEIKQTKEDMEEKKIKLSQDDIDWLKKQIRWTALPGYIAHEEDYNKATEEIMNLFIPSDTEHSNSEKIEKNLKEFDLEAAKSGNPVCTRDGYKARIICFDAKGMHQPIIALITQDNGVEYIETYYSNGRFNDDINSQSGGDLMMLPEKKVGWVNVYKNQIHDTPESAEEGHKGAPDYIKTIKVEWEK